MWKLRLRRCLLMGETRMMAPFLTEVRRMNLSQCNGPTWFEYRWWHSSYITDFSAKELKHQNQTLGLRVWSLKWSGMSHTSWQLSHPTSWQSLLLSSCPVVMLWRVSACEDPQICLLLSCFILPMFLGGPTTCQGGWSDHLDFHHGSCCCRGHVF